MDQQINVQTVVKLDLVDCLKCLFGRCIRISTTVIVPQDKPIETYNAFSATSIENASSYFVRQDKPRFGYTAKEGESTVNVV